MADQPLHVQPLPHRAHPHRRRGSRAEEPRDDGAPEGEDEYPPAGRGCEEGDYVGGVVGRLKGCAGHWEREMDRRGGPVGA